MNNVAASVDAIVSATISALSAHLTVGQSLLINASSVILAMDQIVASEVPNRVIRLSDYSSIRFPSTMDLNSSGDAPVSIHVTSLVLMLIARRMASRYLGDLDSDGIWRSRIASHNKSVHVPLAHSDE